ncbi:hypothetical protein [Proteiniclasticum sp.]|nr:hypothetical protein [Proteiniclasticum sp.]
MNSAVSSKRPRKWKDGKSSPGHMGEDHGRQEELGRALSKNPTV